MAKASFDLLTPDVVAGAIEAAYDLVPTGTWVVYPSYINRVYGLSLSDGRDVVAKFYRPGRWSRAALEEEQDFVEDCRAEGIPVLSPIATTDGESLAEIEVETDDDDGLFCFSLFPRLRGRNFDPETDDDWRCLGLLVGRCHNAGAVRMAPHRPVLHPGIVTTGSIMELESAGVVHPKVRDAFIELCWSVTERIKPLFDDVEMQRIHGDFHRGNIFSAQDGSLEIIDFDDCMTGPVIQDVWLNLPGAAACCGRELDLFAEGYERVATFPAHEVRLIEPLRFMRMVYHLAWTARQSADQAFARNNPEWSTEGFWLSRFADLREQVANLEVY